MLAIEDVLTEERIRFVKKREFRNGKTSSIRHNQFSFGGVVEQSTRHSDRPRAVVLHDSFLLAMEPFLTEAFSYVSYRWDRTNFPYRKIEREQPDVVIQLFVERLLMAKAPQNPPGMIDSPILWTRKKTTEKIRQ